MNTARKRFGDREHARRLVSRCNLAEATHSGAFICVHLCPSAVKLHCYGLVFAAAFLTVSLRHSEAASTIVAPQTGLSVGVDLKTGTYRLASRNLAWTFEGSL